MAMFEILIGVLILWKLHRFVRSRMRSAIYLARKETGSTSRIIPLRDCRRAA